MPQPMTSDYSGGNAGNSASSSQLFNSISSNGVAPEQPQQSEPEKTEASSAELAIQRVGGFISSFGTLAESYPQASKEASEVSKSLQKWLEAIVMTTSSQGSAESNSI